MTTKLLTVPDISCEHCERAIKQALAGVGGVESVVVDIPGHQVTVQFDDAAVSLERIKDVLREEEYPVAAVV